MFRTGDVMGFSPEGKLIFIDRLDSQVNLHGTRIEPSEIEAKLRDLQIAKESVVALHRAPDGATNLVAFIVGYEGTSVDAATVRKQLSRYLPAAFVPTVIVPVSSLPMTTNGKVNRKNLLESLHVTNPTVPAYKAPYGVVEIRLARIWESVLGMAPIGITQSFVSLGGDSISALRIVSLASRHNINIHARDIFENETIERLAAAIGNDIRTPAQPRFSGIATLTPIQRWFFRQDFVDPDHFTQAVLLGADGPLDSSLVRKSLSELVAHHDALRAMFFKDDHGEWAQFISDSDEGLFNFEEILLEDGERIESAVLDASEAAAQHINLSGPLVCARLLTHERLKEYRLLLIIHHLVVDAVSWGILVEDFAQAYSNLTFGSAVVLPPRTTALGDWAVKLERHTERGAYDRDEIYWIQQQRRGLAIRRPEWRRQGIAGLVGDGAVETISLDRNDTDQLASFGRSVGAQFDEILLAALASATRRWVGTAELSINMERHGREPDSNYGDIARTVGWFTCMFPVVLPCASDSAAHSLKEVRRILRSVPSGGVSYGALLSARGRKSALDPSYAPTIGFNYLGRLDQFVGGSGLRPATEPLSRPRSLRQHRPHVFELSGHILAGQLILQLEYNAKEYDEGYASGFLKDIRSTLKAFPEAPTPTVGTAPERGAIHQSKSRLVTLSRQKRSVPMVFVPGAGGSPFYLNKVVSLLKDSGPIYAFQAKGLDGMEEPHLSIVDMAIEYAETILRSDVPTLDVVGHSLGGWVGYQLCVELDRRGLVPRHLILLDTPAPPPYRFGVDNAWKDWTEEEWFSNTATTIARALGRDAKFDAHYFRERGSPVSETEAISKLRREGYIPGDIPAEVAIGFFRVTRASYKAREDYFVGKANLKTPLTLLKASEPRHAQDYSLEEFRGSDCWGWKRLAEHRNLVMIPGDHISILADPYVATTAKAIASAVEDMA